MPTSPSGKASRGANGIPHDLPADIRQNLLDLLKENPDRRRLLYLGSTTNAQGILTSYLWYNGKVHRTQLSILPAFGGTGAQRIAVIGSRDFANMALVRAFIASRPLANTIISGAARGVDTIAELAARARGLAVISIPANWATGRAAGMVRNQKVVDAADAVVAFWDGKSTGTRDAITKAIRAGKPTIVYDRTGTIIERHNIPAP